MLFLGIHTTSLDCLVSKYRDMLRLKYNQFITYPVWENPQIIKHLLFLNSITEGKTVLSRREEEGIKPEKLKSNHRSINTEQRSHLL